MDSDLHVPSCCGVDVAVQTAMLAAQPTSGGGLGSFETWRYVISCANQVAALVLNVEKQHQ